MINSEELPPPRILLLEDDPAMRDLLAVILEDEGYEVIEDSSTSTRIQRMAEGDPPEIDPAFDLIVSDVRMPGRTGLEILEGLRNYDFLQPVVLITAFGSRETHREARRLGATVLDKPFDMDELLSVVRELCTQPPTGDALPMAAMG